MDLYSYFYDLVMQIPKGRVSTYGALARALGDIRAARACGFMLSQNPDPPRIPCHRVVRSDGSLGGFTHPEGIKRKIELLRSEGIKIEKGKVKDFSKVLFEDFKTDYPLKKLRKEQEELRKKVILEDAHPSLIGGVDVSYSSRNAYVALVIMRDGKYEVMGEKMRVEFPYIPTYLAFREGPIISEILKKVEEDILLMIDGNGILHPRFMGLATYVGVKNNIATIGVAKSLLIGEVREGKVYIGSKLAGQYIQSGRKKGIYVSPGHKITLDSAVRVVKRYLKYKNPEPLRLAHIYANKFRREDNA